MHKFTPLIAAAAVCVAGVSLASRADAGALAGADGLRPALDQLSITETVHCTPGAHHRGCRHATDVIARVYRAPAYLLVRLWPVLWLRWLPLWLRPGRVSASALEVGAIAVGAGAPASASASAGSRNEICVELS